ncbi:AI-2E family transporter [Alkalimonas amylolytica]|uniref:Predicted PurR-regulated permease PerM n=1 Tax=Alkalimonas amylolytica TaxID=152573 RepID=A0A1H4D2R4_ALKAM|nr:AI-2E family transporter [Alkalimonas amylolytica]SEA67073.1 Predicted PurR-regulated permease PerM [Alkalimonas amylolytica]
MLTDTHQVGPEAVKASSQSPAAPTPAPSLFSAVELRLFRYTAVLFSLVLLTALIGITFWLFGWLLGVFSNLLLSLSLAGILALVLYPVVVFLQSRLRLPRLLAISAVLLLFFAALGSLVVLLVPTLVNQAVQLMSTLPDSLASWKENFSFYNPELSKMIASGLQQTGDDAKSALPGLEQSSRTIVSYLGLLAGIGFVPLFLFFCLLSGGQLRQQAAELLSIFHVATQQKVLYFMDVFVGYITAFFQGQLIIAVCMGVLYALSFSLLGLEYGVLIGLVLGLLNIIPFLGSLIGLLVVLPMAYLQPEGGVELMVLAGLVFVVVQVIESWLLTPKIMANRSGLHPALVVISLFFWGTALGGIIGMVLAVPLTAFFVATWSELKTSLKQLLSSGDARLIMTPEQESKTRKVATGRSS